MKIQVFSKQTGLSVDTLRYYEKEGMIYSLIPKLPEFYARHSHIRLILQGIPSQTEELLFCFLC